MIGQLAKLRENRFRKELSDLKKRSESRRLVERTLENATLAVQQSITSNIRELGLFGEIRLGCIRSRKELSRQILHHSERVIAAKKMAESARSAHKEMVEKRLAAEETARERDAEQFLSWSRGRRG